MGCETFSGLPAVLRMAPSQARATRERSRSARQQARPQTGMALGVIFQRRTGLVRRHYLQLVGCKVAPDAKATQRRVDVRIPPKRALEVAAHTVIYRDDLA